MMILDSAYPKPQDALDALTELEKGPAHPIKTRYR